MTDPKITPDSPATEGCAPVPGSVSVGRVPVPIGALIQPWHWWLTPELSMTEAERAYYYGNPLTGQRVERTGRLFEVRIPNVRMSDRR